MSLISLSCPCLTIFLGVIFSLVALLVTTLVIKPLINLQFYKKQGIPTSFAPGLGWLSNFKKGEREHGDNLYFVKQNAKQHPKSEIEASNLGPNTLVLFYSPRLLKPFFAATDAHIKYKSLQPISLFAKMGFGLLEGNIFRKHRQTVSGIFSFNMLGAKVPTMQTNAQLVLDRIEKNGTLNKVNVIDSMVAYSGDNVADLFFGGHIRKHLIDGKPFVTFSSELQSESGLLIRSLPLFFFGPKIVRLGLLKSHRDFNEKVKKFRKAVAQLIEDRQKSGIQEQDLIQVLLETRKSNDPDVVYSDEMIIDEYISLFVAGADNPAHTMTLALYELSRHPEYKKQLLAEIAEIYDKEPVSTQSLHRMNLLHGLVQETLRLHSPSFSTQPKVAVKDFEVENYKVKKGSILLPIFYHSNYSEEIFTDAFKFKPERWADGKLSLESFQFIPFGAGARNCVGQHFAQLEIKVMLCEFLKRFDYDIEPGYVLEKTQKFLHVPKQPVPFNLRAKH